MKDKIICIVGRSGSGKTTVAEYLEELYGLKIDMLAFKIALLGSEPA